MRSNHDHYYCIGKTHTVCQDYVIQGDTPVKYIVLSDGCSSSPDTDVGARLLCTTVKKVIERYLPLYLENDTKDWSLLPDYKALGETVSTEASGIARLLALPDETLDATLLIAFMSNDVVHVYVYGDGCILLKDKQGRHGYIDISFTSNAPYYLNYWQNSCRRTAYAREFGEQTLAVTDSLQNISGMHRFDKGLSFSFPLSRYAFVGIASDGLDAFLDVANNRQIALSDVVENILDFKNLNGEFVKRRLPKMLQRYAQQGVEPLDDVSVGVFAAQD